MNASTTPGAKDRARVLFFPPGVPLLAVLAGIGLQRAFPLLTDVPIPVPDRYWFGGALILGAIGLFGAWPVLLFKRAGQDPNPWKPTPRIVERGPYRITRNPMYLQMVIACVGFAVLLSNVWILLLTPVVAFVLWLVAIRPEEAYLEEKFGDEYVAYKRRVRRWL